MNISIGPRNQSAPTPTHRGRRAVALLAGLAASAAVLGFGSLADAAWYQGGVLVSNVCRAPSGAYWVYPAYDAQAVGTSCSIPTTGELGVVTVN